MSSQQGLSRSTSRGSDYELTYASPIILTARGADDESVTRHNRKKRARAYSDEEGKLNDDGRQRRSRGSSDDEDSITWDGFTNEDLRVGGPYLCSLPLSSRPVSRSNPLHRRICSPANPILAEIRSILHQHRINYTSAAFLEKRSQFNPEAQPVLTAAISAQREQRDNVWLQASREIRAYLIQQGLIAISVEISDPLAFVPSHGYPVLGTDAIFAKWASVRDTILATIDLTDVKVVGCYRYGKSSDRLDNPPTVVIIADSMSNRNWKGTRELIVNVLNRAGLPMVAVGVMKDNIRLLLNGTSTLQRHALRGPAILGQSLSIHDNTTSSGTLGGFIELKHPRDNSWKTFGITCFHCVIPTDEEISRLSRDIADKIKEWSRHGIPMGNLSAAEHLYVDHPSLRDLSEKLRDLESKIQDIIDSDFFNDCQHMEEEGLLELMPRELKANFLRDKTRLEHLREFAEEIRNFRSTGNQLLGNVIAGSGFRQRYAKSIPNPRYPSNVDWALIRIKDLRQGENTLPNGYELLQYPGLDIEIDEKLCIQGRSSGYSEGFYNALQDATITTKMLDGQATRIITLEHSITSHHGMSFSKIGDSGALVHQKGLNVVGMVFAGFDAQNWTYFTHLKDLFDDILERTGAKDIRLLTRP